MANFFSKERHIGLFRMLTSRVNRNEPKIVVQIQENDFLITFQDLKRKPAGIVSRDTANNAKTLRIDGRGQIMLQCSFACGRQRQLEARQILPDVPDRMCVARAFPVSAEVRVSISRSRSWPVRFYIRRR